MSKPSRDFVEVSDSVLIRALNNYREYLDLLEKLYPAMPPDHSGLLEIKTSLAEIECELRKRGINPDEIE